MQLGSSLRKFGGSLARICCSAVNKRQPSGPLSSKTGMQTCPKPSMKL